MMLRLGCLHCFSGVWMTSITIEGARIYIATSKVVPRSRIGIVSHLESFQFITGCGQPGKASLFPRQFFPQNYSSIHAPGMTENFNKHGLMHPLLLFSILIKLSFITLS